MEDPVELARAEADGPEMLAEAEKMVALKMPQEFAKKASITKEKVSKLYRLMVFTCSIHQQKLVFWMTVREAAKAPFKPEAQTTGPTSPTKRPIVPRYVPPHLRKGDEKGR